MTSNTYLILRFPRTADTFSIVTSLIPGGFNWTQSPQNVTQVAVGASISLQWSYDVGEDANVTSIDFRRTRPGERNTSAIGSIDRYGVASELGVYEGHVTLTHMNQSAILRINAVKATDEAQYCCKLKTTKANVEKCARLQVYGEPNVLPFNPFT